MLKRIFFAAVSALAVVTSVVASEQPKWGKKVAKSVFTLKTFDSDGRLKASSNGFFVSNDGVAVGNFTPFRGASKAVIIDADGKEWPVACVMGANDMYDLAKFRVNIKKSIALPMTSVAPSVHEKLWLLPYAAKKSPICTEATLSKAEKVQGDNTYYTLSLTAPLSAGACPLLNANGELVAMLQQPVSEQDTVNYAVDANFAVSLKLTGLSINDAVLKSTNVKKDLPEELNQAVLTLYVAPSVLDSVEYEGLLNDFVAKFPQASDGYVAKAQWNLRNDRYADADAEMAQALKVAEKKDEAHFSYAKLIFQKEVYKADKSYAPWTLDKAVAEADAAYTENPLPVYHELKAQILFTQKRYDEASALYDELAKTSLRSAALFLDAARCKEMLRDTTAMIALLDSAVKTFNRPYLKAAAPYLLARAQALMGSGKYRAAMLDLNDYEKLMPTEVNARFYYVREQCERAGHLYQQALDDIKKAIDKAPQEADYYAEKASLEVRVGFFDDAIGTAQECIKLDAASSDGYLLLGLAQCMKGNKTDGVENLRKAKQMGNEQAGGFLETYGK